MTNNTPWAFLEGFRGKLFRGQWPTIPEMFAITCSRFGDRKAFTAYEPAVLTFTYEQALERVRRTAAFLQSRGVKPGDRVALTGKNSPEWALAYLAILFAGAVVIPLDYQWKFEELSGLIDFAGARLLFVDEEKYDLFEASSRGLKEKISLSPSKPGYILQLPEGKPFKPAAVGDEELAAIMFTSGTTGDPKGVMLTHRNLVSDTYLAQANLSISRNDVFYALLPIHHSYTMTAVFLEAISVGAEIVFGKKMVSKQILADLKRGRVTMFLGVPMLFNRLLAGLNSGLREKGPVVYALIHTLMALSGAVKKVIRVNPGKRMFGFLLEKLSLEHIRICISGGGPLPAATFRQYNQLGIDFVQGYGLTETSPIVTLNPTDRYKVTSVGKLIPRVEARIEEPDEQGRGEIALRGPMVMQGYYNNPNATREAFSADGFFLTGDVGYLDRDDYLYLTGRKKSLIVTAGGKNVYPEEIEDHFQLYPEIEQILVRGYMEDERQKVEAIEALIYPRAEHYSPTEPEAWQGFDSEEVRASLQRIIDEVNGRLLPYQRISRFRVLEEPMETSSTKKIKRFTVQ
ncbi:MAG: AMP-binding protein [Spirochaetales bacterium]|nr:AMP-binding protein [Spirochaetales bacterium]